jgi:hypothetical protein
MRMENEGNYNKHVYGILNHCVAKEAFGLSATKKFGYGFHGGTSVFSILVFSFIFQTQQAQDDSSGSDDPVDGSPLAFLTQIDLHQLYLVDGDDHG